MKMFKRVILSLLAVCALGYTQVNAQDLDSYKLGAGDTIQVSVYGEKELSISSLYIPTNGTFDYPYLGKMTAINKTSAQLQKEIEAGLTGAYLIEPQVRVNIVSFRNIYINGEVKKPGGYPYQPGLTVEKAIALAGGFTERAARKDIELSSGSETGEAGRSEVELSNEISAGDVIFVDDSFF
ncbi:polysaccharide export protein [Vibrio sp.]|nr:polysaccharide export protein [Vibrio sp.]